VDRFVLFTTLSLIGGMSFAVSTALAGSGSCSLGPGDHTSQTLSSGGLERVYDVYVPPGCDPEQPFAMVLDFHGGLSTRAVHRLISDFRGKAQEHGFVLVQPEGTGDDPGDAVGVTNSWNVGYEFLGPKFDYHDDVAFVRELVARVGEQLPIDPQRIYATGHSMGGGMAHLLACRAADLFRAVAPVAFWLQAPEVVACDPSRPIPVRIYHAFYDGVVCYDESLPHLIFGDVDCPAWEPHRRSAPDGFARWRDIDGCTGTPTTLILPVFFSRFDEFTSCRSGARVGLWSLTTNYNPQEPCPFNPFVTCPGLSDHNPYTNLNQVDIEEDAWQFFVSVPEPRRTTLALAALIALATTRAARRRWPCASASRQLAPRA